MKDIKITDIKKHLKSLTKDEIEKEILTLIKNYKEVKEYFSIKLNEDNIDEILNKYKEKILIEFFPNRGFGSFNFTNIRKTISDFKKISTNNSQIVDLTLYAVEQGVNFTNTYGDINERFYMSIEKLYDEATRYMVENNLAVEFVRRCDEIVTKASGIGWGFSDTMEDIYYNNLSDYIEYLEDEGK